MKLTEIKSMSDIFKYFKIRSATKAMDSIKNSKLSTETKKDLSYKIYKETKNKPVLSKKSKMLREDYLNKYKTEEKLKTTLKEKYGVKDIRQVKKLTSRQKTAIKIDKPKYTKIKEKGKPSYDIKIPTFKETTPNFMNPNYDVYGIAKVREGKNVGIITIPMDSLQYKKMKLMEPSKQLALMERIAQDRKQRYMNLPTTPDIEILSISEIKVV